MQVSSSSYNLIISRMKICELMPNIPTLYSWHQENLIPPGFSGLQIERHQAQGMYYNLCPGFLLVTSFTIKL